MSEGMEAPQGGDRRLNRMVATTVVVLSVVMAVGKIKDENVVQAMRADQAEKIDLWGEYQATRIKARDQQIAALLLARTPGGAGDATAATTEAARYKSESNDIRAKAEADQQDYEREEKRHDQFDLSDGFLSVALALAAIAALLEWMSVLMVAWGAAAFGILFLVAGFAKLPIHPDALVSFLS
jgi:hypothetical protein